jgi:hypothetical protein
MASYFDKIIQFINRFWLVFIIIGTYFGLLFVTSCLGVTDKIKCVSKQLVVASDTAIFVFKVLNKAAGIASDVRNLFTFNGYNPVTQLKNTVGVVTNVFD